jgi:amino acid transporter
MCKRPLYLATCVYGIPFICLGTMAGNSILFAESIIEACGYVPSNGAVRGLAIAVGTLACLLHAVWRKGGIYLNNAFGMIKIAMLIMLFVVGIASRAGAFKSSQFETPAEIVNENLAASKAFSGASTDSYGYAEAFLAIIFAYGGFNQANYVSALVHTYHPNQAQLTLGGVGRYRRSSHEVQTHCYLDSGLC